MKGLELVLLFLLVDFKKGSSIVVEDVDDEPVNEAEDACFSEVFPSDPACVHLAQETDTNITCKVLKCLESGVTKCIKDIKKRENKLMHIQERMRKMKCSSVGISGGTYLVGLSITFIIAFSSYRLNF